MRNKDKSEINPDIINKINNSSAQENVKECMKELIEFEYESIDQYGLKFKKFYLDSIEKWKKSGSGDD